MSVIEVAAAPGTPRITAMDARGAMLRDGPILPTLLRMSGPNLIALCSATIVSVAETAYVGSLGVASLGGIALAFPVFMLMQMLSAGAMGGTVSGAISRALGADDVRRAQALALAALVICLALGLLLAASVLVFGEIVFRIMGGSGAVLGQALAYANVAAFGIVGIWASNTLSSIARGSGNMAVPAVASLVAGLVQVLVGGAFGLGVGPFPRLGIAGVAIGQLAGSSSVAFALLLYLQSSRSRLRLDFSVSLLDRAWFREILRVGVVAMLSPLLSVSTILVLTAMVARFGPEALAGYGIGVRLEFLLIPIAFSVGVASVPLVGTAMGAGNVIRARKIAWTGGALAAGALGLLGAIVALMPWLWVDIFTDAAAVRQAANQYLTIAGVGFPFFGLGLCLYFASQGAGRVGGAITAQALRLATVLAGGWLLQGFGLPLGAVFALSALSMVAMGLGTALLVKLSRW